MWSVTFSMSEKPTRFEKLAMFHLHLSYSNMAHHTSGLNPFSGALEAKRGRQPPSLQSSCSLMSILNWLFKSLRLAARTFHSKHECWCNTSIINYTNIIAKIYIYHIDIYTIIHITSWTISFPSTSLKLRRSENTFSGFQDHPPTASHSSGQSSGPAQLHRRMNLGCFGTKAVFESRFGHLR